MIEPLSPTITPVRVIEKRSSQQGIKFVIIAFIERRPPDPRPQA